MGVLGDNIKKYREIKGLTQKDVADLIGKSKNVVSNWENGINKPDADTIELLLDILDVDANTLLGWNDKKQREDDAKHMAKNIPSNKKVLDMLPIFENATEEDMSLIVNLIKRFK